MKITKEENYIEINITPTFYIIACQQWSDFLNKQERIRGIDIIFIRYERDHRLDRHNLVFGFLGIVLSFRKNVFD